jgi:hypothetical protein
VTSTEAVRAPGAVLRRGPGPAGETVELGGHLWAFAGLHGGLSLALVTAAMQEQAGGAPLRSVTGRFHRTIRGPFAVEASQVRAGRALTACAGRVTSDRGLHIDASATFAPAGAVSRGPALSPAFPAPPPPGECPRFVPPPEFVPIAEQFEIRPVGPNRPYAGGTEPALTAWIRLVEDDEPPDAARLVVLVDALAPSYAAVLPDLRPIPTVELTVRPATPLVVGGRDGRAASPWVLLHAETRVATPDGWIEEHTDTWGPDGTYLGSAQQLRIVRDL